MKDMNGVCLFEVWTTVGQAQIAAKQWDSCQQWWAHVMKRVYSVDAQQLKDT